MTDYDGDCGVDENHELCMVIQGKWFNMESGEQVFNIYNITNDLRQLEREYKSE